MFMPGPTEMFIILFIALLLFGKRLPGVAKSLGQSFHIFRSSLNGEEAEPASRDGAVPEPASWRAVNCCSCVGPTMTMIPVKMHSTRGRDGQLVT